MLRKTTLYSIWLLVFAIPWENMIVFPVVGSLSRVAGVLALGIGILAFTALRQEVRLHALHLFILIFLFWGGLTFFWSADQELSLTRLATYMQLLLMSWLIYQWVDDEKSIHALLVAYVIGCYVSVVSLVFNFSMGVMAELQRYSATGFNPNDLSIILTIGIPVSWYLSLKRCGGRFRVLFLIYPFLALFCIALTGSRNGLISCLIALSYVVWTSARLALRYRLLLIVVSCGTIIAGLTLLPMQTWERWSTIGFEITEGTLNDRLIIWRAGLDAFAEKPIVGNGVGAFRAAVSAHLGHDLSPHNVYLAILVEMGLLGLILFGAILFSAFSSAWRMPRVEKLFWLTLLSVWSLSAMSLNWEWRKQTWLFFTLAVAHATTQMARRTENEVVIAFGQEKTAASDGIAGRLVS